MSLNRERGLAVALEKDAPHIKSASNQTNGKGYIVIKRIIDMAGAASGLILFLPIFLIIAMAYLFADARGPVIFKQKRVGREGRIFYIYKFRTMVINAESVLRANKKLYEKYKRNNYKLEQAEDPRITKIGRFLRKTSLDELPQLINVLKGDMSLVGPRPIVVEELKEYSSRASEFLSVSPGITGYWQVCGRSNVGYPERVDIELHYVYHQSIKLDMVILMKTIIFVLLRKGAY